MTQFKLAETALIARGASRQKLGDEEVFYQELNGLRLNFIPTYIELDEGEARVAVSVIGDLPDLSSTAYQITQTGGSDWHTVYRDRWTEILPETDVTRDRIEAELDVLFRKIEGLSPQKLRQQCFDQLPQFQAMLQACHLAARADAGDVETLQSYRDRFASGDRLNFVPMFKLEMLDRAIEISRLKK